MAIPSRQIGWSTKANLLWQISKQLEQLIKVSAPNKIKDLIALFKLRVGFNNGTFEAEACLNAILTNLDNINLLNKASLIITPNAYNPGVLYSVIPNTTLGDMTVVRATTATRVNSAGLIESVGVNIPRIDYTNGSCPSLLIEPQRTNLLTYSNDFSNLIWVKTAFSTVTTDLAVQNPSGVSPTFRFNPSNIPFGVLLRQSLTTTVGQTYTFSYFAKKGNYRYIGIRFNNARNGERFPTYDFDTDTLNKQGVTCDLSRTLLTNGWVRLSLTFTSTIATSVCDIALTTSNGNTSTVLSGTEFVYIFGAQTELGAYGTSYIPTVASTTRNADLISKTGISSLIGQTEGTIFLEADVQKRNASDFYIGISNNGLLAESIYLTQSANGVLNVSTRSGGATITINVLSVSWNIGNNKIAIAYNSSSVVIFINGQLKGTIGIVNLPTCNQITVGSRIDAPGTLVGSGPYKQAALFKTRLIDTELASLTTI